jgi:hypothetical protein
MTNILRTAMLTIFYAMIAVLVLQMSANIFTEHRVSILTIVLPLLMLCILSVFAAIFQHRLAAEETDFERQDKQYFKSLEEKSITQPEVAKHAWDLARAKLELYFDRNLSQVKLIFNLSVAVMTMGFIFVLVGVVAGALRPEVIKASYISAAAGIITEFVGVTFLSIYRSTVSEAGEYMSVLERINTVGMAVQMLDSIPETEVELKNGTRAQISKLLLSPQHAKATVRSPARPSITNRGRKPSKAKKNEHDAVTD